MVWALALELVPVVRSTAVVPMAAYRRRWVSVRPREMLAVRAAAVAPPPEQFHTRPVRRAMPMMVIAATLIVRCKDTRALVSTRVRVAACVRQFWLAPTPTTNVPTMARAPAGAMVS